METPEKILPRKHKWVTFVLLLAAALAFTAWLIFTPPGLEGKMHAAGYSVCHQLESHSLTIGGKYLPLCARCTGTFMGILLTLIFLSRKGKNSGVPSKLKMAILILFFAVFALDGINSAISLVPGMQPLYPPDNRLRLLTGLLFGISLGTLTLTLWNQTMWQSENRNPLLQTWRQFAILLLVIIGCGALILADIPWLYFPIAVLSTGTIFLILSIIYALLWCIILKKENTLNHFREGIRIYSAGVITAIFQVGLMDLLRYLLTGTWNSF